MIETKIPKDIRVYKTKVIGPFTLRQTVCVILAAGVDVLLCIFFFRRMGIALDIAFPFFVLIDTPILLFTREPYGIPMEKYLVNVLWKNIVKPTRRKEITKLYDRVESFSARDCKRSKKRVKKMEKFYSEYKARR